MPRGFIPFRGDNYSKEETKRRLNLRKASPYERFFAWLMIIFFGIIIIYITVLNYGKEFILFWVILLSIVGVIIYFAYKDAREIGKKEIDENEDDTTISKE